MYNKCMGLYKDCWESKIPPNKSLFNLHDSSHGRHVNAMSGKRLDIQAQSITKQRTVSKWKFEKYKF